MQPGHTYEFRWYVSYLGSPGTGIVNLDNPKLFIQSDIDNLLPVTLTSFSTNVKDCTTQLIWTTGTEDNLSNFEVEKSLDNANNFLPIAMISPKGDNSVYYYTDLTPGANIVYYRLKMTDKNGYYQYSSVNDVLAGCLIKITITNPVHDILVIKGLTSGQKISIYNMNGSLILSKNISGTTEEISLSGITAGIYVIRIFQSSDAIVIRTMKFVKL